MFLEAEEQPDTMDARAFPMLPSGPGKGCKSSAANPLPKPKSVWQDPSRQIIGVNVVFGDLVHL